MNKVEKQFSTVVATTVAMSNINVLTLSALHTINKEMLDVSIGTEGELNLVRFLEAIKI